MAEAQRLARRLRLGTVVTDGQIQRVWEQASVGCRVLGSEKSMCNQQCLMHGAWTCRHVTFGMCTHAWLQGPQHNISST